ncbi:hypothetical protein [Nocardia seriolae]|uniref:hypothetical protein n=1 Tax=Nocardia seriolae TaxID=37332 RepID=UPI00187FA94D|nr:hypothetical protein [Nocardia seriolae]QOW33873.1 hypothetical protein IMZ23_01530 [Nocardia seriolae]
MLSPVPTTVRSADGFDRVVDLLAAGDPDAAAELFLTEQVGVPAPMVTGMRGNKTWPWIRTAAQALATAIPTARRLEIPGADHEILNHPELLEEHLVS